MEATNEVEGYYDQAHGTTPSEDDLLRKAIENAVLPEGHELLFITGNPTERKQGGIKRIRNKRSYKTELEALENEHWSLMQRSIIIGAVAFVGWALAIWFIIAYFIK